jgi:acetoacetyl-CoA synthetase
MVLLVEVDADTDDDRDGDSVDDERRAEVKALLRERCSPRHAPAFVEAVPELPRTMNGKLSVVAATAAINGRADPGGSLANAESLAAIRALGERLRTV